MIEEHTLRDVIFRTVLKFQDLGPTDMAKHLGANYNSVKAALAKLADDCLLEREGRGNYVPNYSRIILHLLDRIEVLEKRELGGIEHI